LRTSINIAGSIAFIKFLVSDEGQHLVKYDGLIPINASIEQEFGKILSILNLLLEIRSEG
jgi:ABC-type Fe3+ transport system substrate-binding protein